MNLILHSLVTVFDIIVWYDHCEILVGFGGLFRSKATFSVQ